MPGLPLHLVHRGARFVGEDDRAFYRAQLGALAAEFGVALHAYVLMDDHVHLLLTPSRATAPALLMKHLGLRHARRVGGSWRGRFRFCVVQPGAHLLACMRYVEHNPVRAGLASHPRDWRWSSYRANVDGSSDGLVTPHPTWLALGADDAARRRAYRALVETAPPTGFEAIRAATRAGAVLGDRRFAVEVEALLARRLAIPRWRTASPGALVWSDDALAFPAAHPDPPRVRPARDG